MSILYPNMYVPSVTEINAAELRQRGIRHLLLDLDNTIVRRDRDHFPPEVEQWLTNLLNSGFKLCIVSNNGDRRVNSLAGPMQIPCVVRAVKPLRRAFMRGMRLLDAQPGSTAVVGDQIFTDILGGNMLGLFTILVVPMSGSEFWGTSLVNRRLEKLVLRRVSRLVSHEDKQYYLNGK